MYSRIVLHVLLFYCGISSAQLPAYIDRTIPDAISRAKDLSPSNLNLKRLYTDAADEIGRQTLLDVHRGLSARTEEESPSLCAQHVALFIKCLFTGGPQCSWAQQMLDAAGKPGAGILRGDITWLGSYSQCMAVTAQNITKDDTGNVTETVIFRGQYCRAYVPLGNVSTAVLSTAVCIPDTCSTPQFYDLIHSASSSVKSATCQPTSQPPLDAQAIAVIVIFASIALLIMIATVYDEFFRQRYHSDPLLPTASMNHQESPSDEEHSDTAPIVNSTTPEMRSNLDVNDYTPHINHQGAAQQKCHPGSLNIMLRCLLAFSLSTNGSKLLNVRGTGDGTLQVVHGVRFLSMSWVILGHVFALGIVYVDNVLDLLDYTKLLSFAPILSGTLSVDSFFLLSGMLTSYLLLNRLRVSGVLRFNWAYFYVHRYWRLTPPYMLVLAFYTTVTPFMAEGPFWPYKLIAPFCDTNWWTNLLYIQNLVKRSEQCFGWAWYLANDMQFFVVSPIFIVPLHLLGWIGLVFPLCGLLGSCVATGVITYLNDYPADVAMELTGITAAQNANDSFNNVYIAPWCRLGPYVVGIMLGYVIHKTHASPPRLNKATVAIGWLVAAGCCLSVVYSLSLAKVPQGHKLSWEVNAFYASIFRPVWAVGLSWLIFACLNGYGGWVNSLLSWPPLTVLSRLTYMAYLLHPMVMFWYWGSLQTLLHVTNYTMVGQFLGFMVATYLFSFVFSLLLESPMLALEKVLMKK